MNAKLFYLLLYSIALRTVSLSLSLDLLHKPTKAGWISRKISVKWWGKTTPDFLIGVFILSLPCQTLSYTKEWKYKAKCEYIHNSNMWTFAKMWPLQISIYYKHTINHDTFSVLVIISLILPWSNAKVAMTMVLEVAYRVFLYFVFWLDTYTAKPHLKIVLIKRPSKNNDPNFQV